MSHDTIGYSKGEGWIGVDLDGTLAEHYWPEKGPYDPLRIGAPIALMVSRVMAWLASGIEVRVFTARVGHRDGRDSAHTDRVREAVAAWTAEHVGSALAATCVKDHALLELWDDRAVRVLHNTGSPCCTPQ